MLLSRCIVQSFVEACKKTYILGICSVLLGETVQRLRDSDGERHVCILGRQHFFYSLLMAALWGCLSCISNSLHVHAPVQSVEYPPTRLLQLWKSHALELFLTSVRIDQAPQKAGRLSLLSSAMSAAACLLPPVAGLHRIFFLRRCPLHQKHKVV